MLLSSLLLLFSLFVLEVMVAAAVFLSSFTFFLVVLLHIVVVASANDFKMAADDKLLAQLITESMAASSKTDCLYLLASFATRNQFYKLVSAVIYGQKM
jgi:hypothetical protein